MGFLTGDDSPVIWRGPMLHGVIQQFFREVRWDRIDYLIVDMPPGTGDVALSLSQTVPVAGAVVVTTPQTVSVADTRRAVRMYQKLNVPMLGLVENMSHFVCPGCQMESDIFGKGGGETLARDLSLPFLGRIPIYEPIRVGGDTGVPITIGEPQSPAARAFRVGRRAARGAAVDRELQAARFPLMPVKSVQGGSGFQWFRSSQGSERSVFGGRVMRMATQACSRRRRSLHRAVSLVVQASDAMKAIVGSYLEIQAQLASDKIDGIKAPAGAIAARADELGEAGKAMAKAARTVADSHDLKAARDAFGAA